MQNILLSGVGGQGTVLASKIIAKAAIRKGNPARTAETIGMAQRGGCVVSHVRIGDDCFSPLIPLNTADVIIGFEPAEAVRVLPYLKDHGTVIVSSGAVKPTTDALSEKSYDSRKMTDYLKSLDIRLVIVNAKDVIEKCGTAKVLNIALLGAAINAGAIDISLDEMRSIITSDMKEQFRDINLQALDVGANSAII